MAQRRIKCMGNILSIPWWKKTTVYQIYPRSYKDSTGDGIGDLQGIISKLDYIKDLGVETVWFSPFYSSPQHDFGYDIANYRDIAPEYGTMADCDQLISEIHARGMKIVLDLVMNHTSDQHPWFIESRSSKENPKRNWYVWRDGKKPGGKAPPNNWQSQTGGPGWHYDATTDQWYWAAFLSFQPDLNYRNLEVKQEMLNTVRFWLDKGADGFRLDILGSIYEDSEFRDNPFSPKLLPSEGDNSMLFKSTKMTINLPETYEFCKELRAIVDEYSNPPRFMVGEVFGTYEELRNFVGGPEANGLHTVFLFDALESKLEAENLRGLIYRFEKHFPEPHIPTWVFSNHDRFRRIDRLGNNVDKAKLNAAFQLTVRGVPYIYYGEEIGMPHSNLPIKGAKDELAHKFEKYPGFVANLIQKMTGGAINRDGCRTPMHWDASDNAGFSPSGVQTWLPLHPDFPRINVEEAQQDPDSLYLCYKRFLKARTDWGAMNAGQIEVFDPSILPEPILAYKRSAIVNGVEQKIYVFLNCSKNKVEFISPIEKPELVVSTTIMTSAIAGGKIAASPLGRRGGKTEPIKEAWVPF